MVEATRAGAGSSAWEDSGQDLHTEHQILNMGPSHPATHGTVKFLIELDGETIVNLDVQVGYLHRGFEKECESGTWYQAVPYTDRLNYNSAILANQGFCLAVEKLLGIETPERCQWLEGGNESVAFASGMAAVNAVFHALSSGDHMILPDDIYFGVRELSSDVFARWGLEYSLVDMTDLDAVRANIRPNTSLIWAETPSNPMLKITDIAAIAEIARRAGLIFGVDGTWATPILQQPLERSRSPA